MATLGGGEKAVTLVGAGLVGSLLSIYLARRGFHVTLFERRPDMRKEAISAGRSINLAISERGLHALRKVGLEGEALGHAIPMRGRMMHAVTGELTFQAYGKDDSQCINSISRAWLNRMLMARAEETGRVDLRFNQRVVAADLGAGTLSIKDERGGELLGAVPAPVVVGTDGSTSAVRQALLGSSSEATQEVLDHGYKELVLPAGPGGRFQLEKHALHIWPRGSYMLIALPNEDGSFTCTLFLPFKGPLSFESLGTPVELRRFFGREFPDVVPLLPNLDEEFFGHPTGNMVTVKASRWHAGGRALLVGDAAHAIVPFFGQGMNCGFEDCVVFDELLERGLGWPELFEAFERARKTQADAIADMAVENFVEMRDRTADARFLLEKQIEKRLLNAFPGEFLSRYTLVSFSRAPYRFAYRVGEVAAGIVQELADGIASAEQVDLERAGRLVRERLSPILKESAYGSAA